MLVIVLIVQGLGKYTIIKYLADGDFPKLGAMFGLRKDNGKEYGDHYLGFRASQN